MKVIIYRAVRAAPFEELFKPIGNFDKVFFSNTKSFDKSQVKVLLPDEEDDSIFVVPEDWKTEFKQLLEGKLGQIAWQEDSSPQKPPKEEIGSGWSEELAKFYDEQVEIISIFIAEKKQSSPFLSNNGGNMSDENELEHIDRDVSHRILTVLSFFIAIVVISLLLWQMTALGELKDLKPFSVIPLLLDKANNAKGSEDQGKVADLCELAGSIDKAKRDSWDGEKYGGKLCGPADKVSDNKPLSDDKSPQDTNIAMPEQINELLKKIDSYKKVAEEAMRKTPACLMTCSKSGESAFEQVKRLVEIESPNEEVKSEKNKVIRHILTKIVSIYPSSLSKHDSVCKQLNEILSFIKEKKLVFAEDVIKSDAYWKKHCASPLETPNHE